MTKVPQGADAPASALPARLLSNLQGNFIPARWKGANTSGLTPRGPNVLVMMDQQSNRTAGGVLLPDAKIDAQNEASETGCVFAIGPQANTSGGGVLEVGQRVYIEKYAGIKALGRDGLVYRIHRREADRGDDRLRLCRRRVLRR
jgi:co-chaperonin GroES (HSP10)